MPEDRSIENPAHRDAETRLVDLVNPLCGTDSEPEFSTGLVYPAVATAGGLTFWSPRNRPGGHVFSRRRSWAVNTITGFTATHSPSCWIGDYGSFDVLPGCGDFIQTDTYRLDTEVSRPDQYAVTLLASGVRCELTATPRCGFMRFTFPTCDRRWLAIRLHSSDSEIDHHGRTVTGVARNHNGGVAGDFGLRFMLELDCDVINARKQDDVLLLDLAETDRVHVRCGTSFISVAQARLNRRRELADRPFETVRDDLATHWQSLLSAIDIEGGTQDQRRTFHTCLWRSLLFPRRLDEIDDAGNTVHYSPYTGRIEDGPLCTDNGFWDTSRSVYPLLSLVYPKRCGDVIDGWLGAVRDSGWLPEWASPGHRAAMVGTHSAAVIADAVTKDIDGFDHREAYEAIKRGATEPGDAHEKFGRQQFDDYVRLGYCPEHGPRDSVCRTLDYAYNDHCVSLVAQKLGDHENAAVFAGRAKNWRKLFDENLKFFRPRNAAGDWTYAFREFEWGGPYREGCAWQYRFAVPHDPAGLAEKFGGPNSLVAAIEAMFETPPTFEVGEYQQVIHEMSEMASADFGQYAHSNQPVHQLLAVPARVGQPEVTDRLIRRVLTELYSPDTFAGDEDNGEMSAWYVLASIGLFPHCPGEPSYTAVPMLFDRVAIRTDDGKTIQRRATDALP
ncbi:MAG: GH92 family glycosyl hydrolase, partial [Planctomycetota bacterium]